MSTCVFSVTYFSISLFLQVRGAQEEEEEDEGVLGSVLLLSLLLVEGISVDTKTGNPFSAGFLAYPTYPEETVILSLLTITGPFGEFRCYSIRRHPPAVRQRHRCPCKWQLKVTNSGDFQIFWQKIY